MKSFLITVAFIAGFAAGTNLLGRAMAKGYDTARSELLGSRCEAGLQDACAELVRVTKGQCSGPKESGCRFSLDIIK